MFKLGFSTIGCPDYGVDEVIALATGNGFDGIEIRHFRGTIDLVSLPEFTSDIAETRRRFEDAGLQVVGINTSVRMNALDKAKRAEAMELARRNLAIATGLGAPYLRVFGGPIPKDQDREATLDAIAEGLGEVADLTAASGVTTLIETHDDFCTSEGVLDLYARGASDNLKVLWDTLHSYRHGEAGEVTWAALADRIRLVHVKDANKATPEAFDFALTGEGNIPVAGFVEILRNNGFDGFLNFEWERGWHPEIEPPEVAIPHFARFMKELG